ncbi:glycosyltransferase [Negadavirga shengliensis]|uniref:Glycosyltransferase n=1 Tax=Negadavirga shengliensis TaxID=1389218 RepID=A0ABV9T1U5_9BACT
MRYFLDNLVKGRQQTALPFIKEAEKAYDHAFKEVGRFPVLLDDHFAPKALFYRSRGIKVTLVSTMILPLRHLRTPPIQSSYIPDGRCYSSLIISFLWTKTRVKRAWSLLIGRMLSLGGTDVKIFAKTYDLRELVFDKSRAFGWGFSNIPLIATYPRALDFVDMGTVNKVFYFGSLPAITRENIEDNRLAGILKLVEHSEKTWVYCSLGTVTSDYLGVCRKFFNRILKGATARTQFMIILNVGEFFDINELGPVPDNVFVFNRTPQAQLLKRIDVMINHGGLNTIKECLAAGVPMLVYPLSLKWDQPGCAARVVKKGIGQRGNIRRDSAKTIYTKLVHMVGNLSHYKENLQAFRHQVQSEEKEDGERLLDFLEDNKCAI